MVIQGLVLGVHVELLRSYAAAASSPRSASIAARRKEIRSSLGYSCPARTEGPSVKVSILINSEHLHGDENAARPGLGGSSSSASAIESLHSVLLR